MSLKRLPSLSLLCVSSALVIGCESTGASTSTTDAVALIAVDPADFPRMPVAGRSAASEALDQHAGRGGLGGAQGFSSGAAGMAGVTDDWLAGSAGLAGAQGFSSGAAGMAGITDDWLAGSAGLAGAQGFSSGAAGMAGVTDYRRGDAGAAGIAGSAFGELPSSGAGGTTAVGDSAGGPANLPRTAVGDCADGVGSYVAELFDVSRRVSLYDTESIEDVSVQSSQPTACDRSVAFSRVVPNRLYEVHISTYAEPPDQLCVLKDTTAVVLKTGVKCEPPMAPIKRVRARQTGIVCYGWQESSADDSATGVAGAVAKLPQGRPGLSVQYRTITLHYCVSNTTVTDA